jgi:hypothetical protein
MEQVIRHVVPLFMLCLGVSYIVNTEQWVRFNKETVENTHRLLPLGVLLLAMGLAILAVHNTWEASWWMAVTLFGWILAIKGAGLLILSRFYKKFMILPDRVTHIAILCAGILMSIVGLFLSYEAFGNG